MASDDKSRIVIEVPVELKKSFKLYCTMNEVPMKEIVEGLIRGYLEERNWVENESTTIKENE